MTITIPVMPRTEPTSSRQRRAITITIMITPDLDFLNLISTATTATTVTETEILVPAATATMVEEARNMAAAREEGARHMVTEATRGVSEEE
jgi:hypothetical protein